MKATRSTDENLRNRALWRASLWALAGAAVSMALAGLVAIPLPPGVARLAISSLVLAMGLATTGFAVWTRTRALAGDVRRPGLVAVLAFLAVNDREWQSLLPLEGHHMVMLAQFALTFLAFGFAMLVFSWLVEIDACEAQETQ